MDDDQRIVVRPLERRDPPMLGDVMIRGRLASCDAGVVYAGQLIDQPVAVVLLTDGAETDSFARARFEVAVQTLADSGTGDVVAGDRDADVATWVALTAEEGWSSAMRTAGLVLAPVTLEGVTSVGEPRGPGYRPHWYRRGSVGRWRVWPLPWPDALSAASRWTFVAAFALMLTIAALALWIATLVFDGQPPTPPPPQVTRTLPPPAPPLTLPKPSPSPSSPPTVSGPSSAPSGTAVPPIV